MYGATGSRDSGFLSLSLSFSLRELHAPEFQCHVILAGGGYRVYVAPREIVERVS